MQWRRETWVIAAVSRGKEATKVGLGVDDQLMAG